MGKSRRLPLADYLRRQKRRRWLAVLSCATALAALIAMDHHGLLLHRSDWSRYHGRTFRVTKVIDGDTIEIAAPDGDRPVTRVRLWGIDTPELARPDEGRDAEPFADEAKALAVRLCRDQSVQLHLEPHQLRGRDRARRIGGRHDGQRCAVDHRIGAGG